MFRYRAVVKVNPSNSCNTVLTFGIVKGFLINLLLTSQKLLRKRMVLFFFGIMNKGEAYSDGSNTSSLTNLSTSLTLSCPHDTKYFGKKMRFSRQHLITRFPSLPIFLEPRSPDASARAHLLHKHSGGHIFAHDVGRQVRPIRIKQER